MASFISALSILILVLSNGCFTLPILDDQLSTSTSSPVNDDVTSGETLNLRMLADDATSMLPDLTTKQPTDEHMGFEMSTSISAQASRSFDELSSSQPMILTTELPFAEKRDHDDVFSTTLEPTASPTEQSSTEKHAENTSLLSSSEPMTFTTEQSDLHKRHHEDLILSTSESSNIDQNFSSTTMEPVTEVAQVDRRNLIDESENGTQQMQLELTTNVMLTTVLPETSTTKSSTSASTEKYIGYLKDNNDDEEYAQDRSTRYMKIQRRPSQKSVVSSTRKSIQNSEEENSREATPPTALFDQKALDQVINVPNDFLVLDENNDLVVTGFPQKIVSSTMNYKEKEELNQGEESLHPEEKESDH